MKLLGIDLETTGLDVTKDRIIEIGMVLWETDTQTPIIVDSFYVNPGVDTWNAEAEAVNGISQETVEEYGIPTLQALDRVVAWGERCAYVVAHNGTGFDKPMIESEFEAYEMGLNRPWLDTQNDIEYPESITTRKLMHLAAEHGFLNPFSHRAVFDVLTMFKILSCYDINQVIAYSLIPTVKVRSMQKFEDNEQAKARGFRWEPETKIWWRTLKQDKLEALQAEAPFKIVVLEGN